MEASRGANLVGISTMSPDTCPFSLLSKKKIGNYFKFVWFEYKFGVALWNSQYFMFGVRNQ
jgi:hypothetical protein